jgi:hypothetical protein
VLCADEKSQIQALDRTQPGLPLKTGRCGTLTHDYKRNGTTTLFAALELLSGTLIGTCLPKHRHPACRPSPVSLAWLVGISGAFGPMPRISSTPGGHRVKTYLFQVELQQE